MTGIKVFLLLLVAALHLPGGLAADQLAAIFPMGGCRQPFALLFVQDVSCSCNYAGCERGRGLLFRHKCPIIKLC